MDAVINYKTVCAICLNIDKVDPRTLSCLHVFCLKCLQNSHEHLGILRCPLCREHYSMTPEVLPSATETALVDPSILCDVCVQKEEKQPAVTYCIDCPKLCCVRHLLDHDNLLGEHSRINMQQYKHLGKRPEVRMCTKHTDKPYTMGCRNCCKVMCVDCASAPDACNDVASNHEVVGIDQLVRELTNLDKLHEKDVKLEKLYKQMSKILCDYQQETRHLVETLQQRRDEQLETIKLKYEGLEKEFLNNRGKTESAMLEYFEEVIGVKWIDLSHYVMKIETKLKYSPQVDIVNDFSQLKLDVERVLSEDLPQLKLFDMASLEVKEEKRDVEVELVYVGNGEFSLDQGLTVTPPPPKSMSLSRSVAASSWCYSVCQYKGTTYLGCQGGVDVVKEGCSTSKQFIPISGRVFHIVVHQDKIYTLVANSGFFSVSFNIHVHELSGRKITNWAHNDTGITSPYNQFAIVENQIVIPHRKEQKLIFYSLVGKVVERLPCSLIGSDSTYICTADKNSVILSDYASSWVGRVDLSRGDVLWTFKCVTNPGGVACYKGEHVLVSKYGRKTTIYILNLKTGQLVSQLTDSTVREPSDVLDLHVSGDTLIVPRLQGWNAVFYKLE